MPNKEKPASSPDRAEELAREIANLYLTQDREDDMADIEPRVAALLRSRMAERDEEFINPTRQVMFRAGLLAAREYLARFVEVQDSGIAESIRANWWPSLGADPGKPRQLRFDEVTDGGEEGPWTVKQISPSVEALPVAFAFLLNPLPSAPDTEEP